MPRRPSRHSATDIRGSEEGCFFEKRRRLHSAKEFGMVFSDRRLPVLREFPFCAYRRDSHRGYARLGIAISRKAAGNAVCRNRIKRRIRETFRQQRMLPAMDFVITCARRNPGQATLGKIPPREISRRLMRLWHMASSAG